MLNDPLKSQIDVLLILARDGVTTELAVLDRAQVPESGFLHFHSLVPKKVFENYKTNYIKPFLFQLLDKKPTVPGNVALISCNVVFARFEGYQLEQCSVTGNLLSERLTVFTFLFQCHFMHYLSTVIESILCMTQLF